MVYEHLENASSAEENNDDLIAQVQDRHSQQMEYWPCRRPDDR